MKRLILLCVMALFSAPLLWAQTTATLTGQVVCSECWFEADRKTTAYGTKEDIACAKRCAKASIPSALAVLDEKGDATLYVLESGAFKPEKDDWSNLAGQRVEVSGAVRQEKTKHFVKVSALKVLGDTATLAPAVATGPAELSLTDLAGAQQSLKDLRGRIVVLNFWATWCGPCKKEMPDLVALQNEYAAFGVQVIGASADDLADKAKVMQYVRNAKINFPIWLGATTAQMLKLDLGQELPATVIIGRDGNIVHRARGVVKPAELRKQLDALLADGNKTAENKTPERHASSVPA